MKTRQDIAPTVDRRRFAEAVRTLETAGEIRPIRPGRGKAAIFTDGDAEKIREALAGHTVSGPEVELSEMRGHLRQLSERMDTERATWEAEQKRAADKMRDLDEERKNGRARIARLEATIQKGRPRGILARCRAAFHVLFGRAAAVPLLAEHAESFELEERRVA